MNFEWREFVINHHAGIIEGLPDEYDYVMVKDEEGDTWIDTVKFDGGFNYLSRGDIYSVREWAIIPSDYEVEDIIRLVKKK